MKKLSFGLTLLFGCLLFGAPLTEEKNLTKLPLQKWRGTVAFPGKSNMKTPQGGDAVCFTYPIIYDASGKPKMTSWPRCFVILPGDMRNWTPYDYFEFSVYTTFNRSDEEYLPTALSTGGVKSRTLISYPITELKQNQWVKISVPLRLGKRDELVRSIQFHLNARRYFPNDKLVLHMGDFKLVRLLEWQALAFKMTAPAIFAGREQLPLEFDLLGPGEKHKVPFRISDARGRKVKDVSAVFPRGFGYHLLPVGKLVPGKYILSVFPDDKQRRNDVPFQVIAPPQWK